ncbi:molybdopterin-guanine dinucleotide biosynthesis protein B [Curvivirga sp.]|uniref:molybdopterin-guanine dinucleotide biosynthesis protein B n=1 Tax=Curvivirga sp. TaxID=2856848 RepID=UPI003B596FD2
MKVFGLAGWSGSGKTTLVKQLIPALIQKGIKLSTIKHAHHNFDIDTPGKDSYEHRHAGATEVMVASGSRWALLHELRKEAEPTLDELIAKMTPVDLLLVEGFKFDPIDKLEIHRPSIGKDLLALQDDHIVAVASDEHIPNLPDHCKLLDLNNLEEVLDFIVDHTGLA